MTSPVSDEVLAILELDVEDGEEATADVVIGDEEVPKVATDGQEHVDWGADVTGVWLTVDEVLEAIDGVVPEIVDGLEPVVPLVATVLEDKTVVDTVLLTLDVPMELVVPVTPVEAEDLKTVLLEVGVEDPAVVLLDGESVDPELLNLLFVTVVVLLAVVMVPVPLVPLNVELVGVVTLVGPLLVRVNWVDEVKELPLTDAAAVDCMELDMLPPCDLVLSEVFKSPPLVVGAVELDVAPELVLDHEEAAVRAKFVLLEPEAAEGWTVPVEVVVVVLDELGCVVDDVVLQMEDRKTEWPLVSTITGTIDYPDEMLNG